ncbi:protein windpipe-like [Contarinia nasturtii]|uniref:protein windpipe-like n=1 Tax=Contarinia nasturtii TaxID=265458 RepID=UPI0012D3A97F|nr:protein windpipe-like [Contarinia nasturtii]
MKVRLAHISFYIFIGTLLLTIGCGDSFTCPEFCSCSEVQRKRYNHAKCTSLDGLRQLGKTSELHSLDLSSMNLTKINNQLDKLTNLSKLDLSDNHLSDLSNLHQRRIRFLNMSGNRITSGKLAKIPTTVKHLNLSHNDITILPENFKLFIHLKSLELSDNPLNCTCETLDVRNWLQVRKVWTEKPIRCMAPLQFKGRSWLQIRQAEVCEPNGLDAPRMLPFSGVIDDENELMMDDHVTAGESDAIEADFIPVNYLRNKRNDAAPNPEKDDHLDENYEGSGMVESYEGSGDENSATETGPKNDDDDFNNDRTFNKESEKLTTKNSSGETNNNESDETDDAVTKNLVVPNESSINDAEIIASNVHGDKETKQESTKLQEPVQESKSTYILLAILGILLVVLILYVATKRSKASIKNRRNNNVSD